MLLDRYLDATGVQDVYFEVAACIQAIQDQRAGKPVPERILDPGFVIHQENLLQQSDRMWGAKVRP
jgi:inositol transport system substrate-binding protein